MRMMYMLLLSCITTMASAQTWSYVGSCCIESGVDGLSSAGSEDLDFLTDGTPVVSFFRQTGGSTTGKVRRYTGGTWEQVGGDLPAAATISAIDLETHENDIYASVLTGGTQINVYHFNGTDWTPVGATISGNLAYDFVIDNIGNLYVFNTLDQAVRKYNGADWDVVLDYNDMSFLQWTNDQSIVVNSENEMFYYHSFLNGVTFTFENYVYRFDGTTAEQVGDMVFGGLGNVGKLGIDPADQIYAQYSSNGTNKITRLEGTDWVQLLDTTNAVNGVFGFTYAFNAENDMLLSTFMQVYYADGYTALPAVSATGTPVTINNLVLGPDNKIYISFGEIPAGEGMNFSVMKLDEAVTIVEPETKGILCYPNPTSGETTVSGLISGDLLEVFDLSGRKVLTRSILQDGSEMLNLDVVSGHYYISIARGDRRFNSIIQIVR